MRVAEAIDLDDGSDGREYRCNRCGETFCGVDENYKEFVACEESGLQDANPLISDPARYIDVEMVLRRYYCPGCGVQLDAEVCRAEDEPLRDIQIY